MAQDNGGSGGTDGRIWRLEQRQMDVRERLDKLEARIEGEQRRVDELRWSAEILRSRVDAMIKRAEKETPAFSIFQDTKLIPLLLYALAAAVIALVGGQLVLPRLIG